MLFRSALFYYEKNNPYQRIIHQLKYYHGRHLGFTMGKWAGDHLQGSDFVRNVDFLVPVPLHPKRLKKRGYNQSEALARGMSEVLNIPVESSTLYRVIEGASQTRKSAYERWDNSLGIFDLHPTGLLQDKHIILIDDVLTTGSTLTACVQAIHNHYPAHVSLFTLACV